MAKFFLKIKTFIFAHKIISGIIILGVIYGGYSFYKSSTSTTGQTLYQLSTVGQGTIVSSVDGSGQVSAVNQIDIKPKVSGSIISVRVAPGQKVSRGQTLFVIDTTNAENAVRDAQAALDSAKLSLEKLKLQNSSGNLSADLYKAYGDALNDISSTFLNTTSTINGLQSTLADSNISSNTARESGNVGYEYRVMAEQSYYQAKNDFVNAQRDYAEITRDSSQAETEKMLEETITFTKDLSDALKDARTLSDYLATSTGRASNYTSIQNTLSGYSNTTNSNLSSLLADQSSIQSAKDAVPSANLDIRSSELSLEQKQNALADAQSALSDYYITAPFDGVMASVDGKVGDDASSGTALGTIITTSKTAVISLNEVDAAKIQLGQKATLTFDALPDLTIAGVVSEVDTIGTVSQGVVSYDIKISFDTEDSRIKPGMTVTAAVITDIAQNVLTVPNSALKSQGDTHYVEIFNPALSVPSASSQGVASATPPTRQIVEVGASDGTNTEITSGVSEGEQIVTGTVTSGAGASSATSATSIFGGNRSGSGRVRIGG